MTHYVEPNFREKFMQLDQIALDFLSQNTFIVLLAIFIIICILLGVRIVPQSE